MTTLQRLSKPVTPFFRIDYHLESTLCVCQFRYRCLLESLGLNSRLPNDTCRSPVRRAGTTSKRSLALRYDNDAEKQLEFYAELSAAIDVTLQQTHWSSPEESMNYMKDALKTVMLLSKLYEKSPELKFLSEGITIQIVDKLKTFQRLFSSMECTIHDSFTSSFFSSSSESSTCTPMEKCETCFTFFEPQESSFHADPIPCFPESMSSSESCQNNSSIDTENPDLPPPCTVQDIKTTTDTGTLEVPAEDILYRCETTSGTDGSKGDSLMKQDQDESGKNGTLELNQSLCVEAGEDPQGHIQRPSQDQLKTKSSSYNLHGDEKHQHRLKQRLDLHKGSPEEQRMPPDRHFTNPTEEEGKHRPHAPLQQQIKKENTSPDFQHIEVPQWVMDSNQKIAPLEIQGLYHATPSSATPYIGSQHSRPMVGEPVRRIVQPFLPQSSFSDQGKPSDIEIHGRAGEAHKTLPKPRLFLDHYGSRCLSMESLQKIMQRRREHNDKFSIVTVGSRDPRSRVESITKEDSGAT